MVCIGSIKEKYMTIHTANLLLVRGIPGSGKSTYAKTLTDYVHFETDMYFSLSGEYKWDGSQLGRAHKWCQNQVRQALLEGKKVVCSNTFIKRWEIKPYQDIANELHVSIEIIEMKGRYPNIHGVSEEHIQKMLAKWEIL